MPQFHTPANVRWERSFAERVWKRADGLIAVAREGELEFDQMKLLHVGDRRIVLARTEQGYAAFDDRCTHKGGPLSDGVLICGTVQCPWHGSQFDAHTGAVKAGPAGEPIASYPVEVESGEILLLLPRG